MKATVWILVSINAAGEILTLQLYPTIYKAQEVMRDEWEDYQREAEEEGAGVCGCTIDMDSAFLQLDSGEYFSWEIHERKLPEE